MRLRLVLEGPQRLMGIVDEKSFEQGSIIIGRSSEADWVISDPNRVISKAHCRIEAINGSFLLTDISTNGVQINGRPIGYNRSQALYDGDMLTLGDAAIRVRLDVAPEWEASSDARVHKVGAIDPFTDGPFGFDKRLSTEAGPAPLTALAAERNANEPILQDWWNPAVARPRKTESCDPMETTGLPAATEGAVSSDLVAMASGVDTAAFARAVEAAARLLSEDDRRKFEGRIRELLLREATH